MSYAECPLCGTEVEFGQLANPLGVVLSDGRVGTKMAHQECVLRSVVGGIGHILDHEFWCLTIGDTDMELGYRESALRVAAWVNEHGAPSQP